MNNFTEFSNNIGRYENLSQSAQLVDDNLTNTVFTNNEIVTNIFRRLRNDLPFIALVNKSWKEKTLMVAKNKENIKLQKHLKYLRKNSEIFSQTQINNLIAIEPKEIFNSLHFTQLNFLTEKITEKIVKILKDLTDENLENLSIHEVNPLSFRLLRLTHLYKNLDQMELVDESLRKDCKLGKISKLLIDLKFINKSIEVSQKIQNKGVKGHILPKIVSYLLDQNSVGKAKKACTQIDIENQESFFQNKINHLFCVHELYHLFVNEDLIDHKAIMQILKNQQKIIPTSHYQEIFQELGSKLIKNHQFEKLKKLGKIKFSKFFISEISILIMNKYFIDKILKVNELDFAVDIAYLFSYDISYFINIPYKFLENHRFIEAIQLIERITASKIISQKLHVEKIKYNFYKKAEFLLPHYMYECVQQNEIDKAVKTVKAIPYFHLKQVALVCLSKGFLDMNDISEALNTANQIEIKENSEDSAYQKFSIFYEISKKLIQFQNFQANGNFDQEMQLIHPLLDETYKKIVLIKIYSVFIENEEFEQAAKVISRIILAYDGKDLVKKIIFKKFLNKLIKNYFFNQAREMIDTIFNLEVQMNYLKIIDRAEIESHHVFYGHKDKRRKISTS